MNDWRSERTKVSGTFCEYYRRHVISLCLPVNREYLRTGMVGHDKGSQQSQCPGQGIVGRKDDVLHHHAADWIKLWIPDGGCFFVLIQRFVRPAVEILGRDRSNIQRGGASFNLAGGKSTACANAQEHRDQGGDFHGAGCYVQYSSKERYSSCEEKGVTDEKERAEVWKN